MSDLRLRTRLISKTLEKVPDHCIKVDREVRSQKIVEKLMSDLKKLEKLMSDLNKTWRN